MTTIRVDHQAAAAVEGTGRLPSASPADPLLRVRGLHKRFGDHDGAARHRPRRACRGDRIAILGASGSGKSTLLRCLNFMERPSAGPVELGGQAIGRAAPAKASAGRRAYDEAELTACASASAWCSSSSTCSRT